jgi:hypothetical protein
MDAAAWAAFGQALGAGAFKSLKTLGLGDPYGYGWWLHDSLTCHDVIQFQCIDELLIVRFCCIILRDLKRRYSFLDNGS